MPRIAVASDLHLGNTTADALRPVHAKMRALRPDALVLAGDIGEGPDRVERVLAMLGDVAPVRGLVLGNHDVWIREESSRALLEERLPEIARRLEYEWLEDRTLRLGDVAVVASMAWYDYSAIDPFARGTPPEEIARKKRFYNMDARRIDWPWSDQEVAERCRAGVARRLDDADADPSVRRIVVVTHVPILEEQMLRRPRDRDWGFSNAYFGNLTIGERALRSPKLVEVVSGHTHAGRDAMVERPPLPPVRARVAPSDYGAPAFELIDLA